MKSKKEYISPAMKIVLLETDNILNGASGGHDEAGGNQPEWARRHVLRFDDWDNEEGTSSFPRSKSVWDD